MLTSQNIRKLRGLAHHLKPVLMVGQHGITDKLLNELNIVLDTHELIKVTISSTEREDRHAMTTILCEKSGAELVQNIGKISVLYRPANPPRLML
jgi:RNA-binding protein